MRGLGICELLVGTCIRNGLSFPVASSGTVESLIVKATLIVAHLSGCLCTAGRYRMQATTYSKLANTGDEMSMPHLPLLRV